MDKLFGKIKYTDSFFGGPFEDTLVFEIGYLCPEKPTVLLAHGIDSKGEEESLKYVDIEVELAMGYTLFDMAMKLIQKYYNRKGRKLLGLELHEKEEKNG